MAYTIKEVENITGISSHTLRFWAKKGLFPSVERDENNVRYFSQKDLDWVYLTYCLRQTGMSVEKIKNYLDLAAKGEDTILERFEIIKFQKQAMENLISEHHKALDKINKKIQYYENLIEKNLEAKRGKTSHKSTQKTSSSNTLAKILKSC